MYLQASLKELTTNPAYIANNVQDNAIAVMAEDKPLFYCISGNEFLQFLAFKQNIMPISPKQKKPIDAFAGMFRNKTNVRLTIDEINQAIAEAGAHAKV